MPDPYLSPSNSMPGMFIFLLFLKPPSSFLPEFYLLLPYIFSLPPLLSPAVRQPSSRSPLRIFTRAALPTIRTHYCQLCHLRPPERQKQRRGGDGTVPKEWRGGRVVYVEGRWSALQHSGYSHKAQCLITNKHWFNQGPEYCRIDRQQLSSSLGWRGVVEEW